MGHNYLIKNLGINCRICVGKIAVWIGLSAELKRIKFFNNLKNNSFGFLNLYESYFPNISLHKIIKKLIKVDYVCRVFITSQIQVNL